jgi:hypothetical protein
MRGSFKRSRRWRRARLLAVGALTVCAGLAVQAAAAQAEQLRFSFGEGRINLGEQKGLAIIDPATSDPPAVLTTSYAPATGAFTAPASGLAFPSKTIENLETGNEILPFVDAVAAFSAISQISGNFNSASGVLGVQSMNVSALISVYPAGQGGNEAQLVARCRVQPVPLPLATAGEIVDDVTDPENPVTYAAAPFTPAGAGVATWATLPAAASAGGPLDALVCPELDGLLGGPGGIWLAGGYTIGPDPARLTIGVKPKRRAIKVGRVATFRVRVSNAGRTAATGARVCVKAPKVLKGKRCKAIGRINPSASAVRTFKLRAKRGAAGRRFRLRFRATANGVAAKGVNAILRVRKPRK